MESKEITERICAMCGKAYRCPPAVSRIDNKTLICPDCGTREALESIGVKPDEQEKILEIIHSMIRRKVGG